MKKLSKFKAYLLVFILFLTHKSYADLLISPTYISFGEKDRVQEVVIINSGNETRNYRLEWKHLVALPEGGYRDLTDDEKGKISGLDRLIRVSPKQVTLSPGQKQKVKLLLRSKGSLKQGEYRSHLSFIALPAKKEFPIENNNASLNLNVLISYSMPIIYRVGSVNVNPIISDLSLVNIKKTGVTNIKVNLYHEDLFSTHGRLVANWTPKNGRTRQVGLLNGYNFYPEVRHATTQLEWQDFKLEPGTLEVRYEGQGVFSGLLLAQKTLTITQQMVNSVR